MIDSSFVSVRVRTELLGGTEAVEAKIAIITPFPGMEELAREVIRDAQAEWPDGIETVTGDLAAGVAAAREAVRRGAEVIVSRGGTASMIAREIEAPVVEIQVTAFDILRALKQAGPASRVGIAGFRNVIYGCEEFGEIWGLPLQEIMMETEAGARDKIVEAVKTGVRVVIGDAVSVRLAVELGLDGYLIQSGKAAIYQAIKQAELVANVRRKEQERSELLRTIINSSTDGILAVNREERITIFNPMAEEVFHTPAAQALGKKVADVIPNTRLPDILDSGTAEIGEIQHIGNKIIATKRVPIKLQGKSIGAIATFQDVTQLQRFEQTVRQKLYAKGLVAKVTLDQVVGDSELMRQMKHRAIQYAATDSTILITGESGTGKEMLAQSVHNLGSRQHGPFVAVNCAALPENLLESELFGYVEGAFTGAKRGGRAGLFELAHGGTIFLDEVGEMPQALQARLLRVLQEKEVMRLGGDRVIPVDVRVIAATNQDLTGMIRERTFRSDLYYRLDILRLHVPPLRERIQDLPLLCSSLLIKFAPLNPKIQGISPAAIESLKLYPWHGNVRELANILERTVLLAKGPLIRETDIDLLHPATGGSADLQSSDRLDEQEMTLIQRVLAEENYNYSRAAVRLGINRSTLWRKLREK